MPTRILFVDDEREIISSFGRMFRLKGFETEGAYNVAEAVAALTAASQPGGKRFDVVCTDLRMPDGNGLDVVRAVRELLPGCPVLVLTAFGSVATSVQAMRLGALTMLEKPIPVDDLEREILAAVADSKKDPGGVDASGVAGLLGQSPAIRGLLDTIKRVATSSSSILIEGESGTGKELVAQAVHKLSRRSSGPLVAVNCAAIPDTLLESELFGHAKGAFTGALQSRSGKFKQADGGTIFLDEIGEMPLLLQGKLLRVLAEHVIEPVGSTKGEHVDFRVVCATNRNLEQLANEGKFRSDLYYRLNVVPLRLPPLRERPGDVTILARHFLQRYARQAGVPLRFSAAAIDALERHGWPGNVRELENLVERLAVLKGEGEIGLEDLPAQVRPTLAVIPASVVGMPATPVPPTPTPTPVAAAPLRAADATAAIATPLGSTPVPGATQILPPGGVDLYAVLRELEDRLISEALERSGGNRKQAAKTLGINRTTLVEKLKKRPPGVAAPPKEGTGSDDPAATKNGAASEEVPVKDGTGTDPDDDGHA